MHPSTRWRSPWLRALLTCAAVSLGLGSLSACERRVGEGAHTPAIAPAPDAEPDQRSR